MNDDVALMDRSLKRPRAAAIAGIVFAALSIAGQTADSNRYSCRSVDIRDPVVVPLSDFLMSVRILIESFAAKSTVNKHTYI